MRVVSRSLAALAATVAVMSALPFVGSASQVSHAVTPDEAQPNIVNGQRASYKDFPSIIAGLRVGGGGPQGLSCTASVVAKRKVLTAAHCMIDVTGDKSYLYGDDDLSSAGDELWRSKVTEFKVHPKYTGPNSWKTGYDVAVVTVADDIPVPESQWARFATSQDTALTQPGKQGTAVGYGKTSANGSLGVLYKTTLPINDPSTCQVFDVKVDANTMVCAGYNDGHTGICSGDSGGPLIVDGVVVGVTSWGAGTCDRYSIYGRLTNDMGDWAHQQVGSDPPPTGTFSIGADPSSVKVKPGEYVSTTITSTAGEGRPEQIALSADGLPAGAKATFQPDAITAGGNAKLTLETATSTPNGEYKVTVTGKGTSGSKTTTVTLTVGDTSTGDLKLTATPSSGSGRPGAFLSTKIGRTGGAGNVSLTVSGGPSGGFPPLLSPSSISAGQTATMTVLVGFNSTPGSYKYTVTGTDTAGHTGTVDYTVNVTGVVKAKQHYGDQYIVVLKDALQSSASLTQRYGGQVMSTYQHVLHGFSVKGMTPDQAQRLANDPAVRTVYEDGTAHATDTQTNPTWGLDRIDQKNLPLDQKYTFGNAGAGVTAYDLDTGINPENPEYENRASIGKDFVGGDGRDCNGHGSHTAGTISSRTYGVAKQVKIVGLKVLGNDCSGNGPDSAAVDAMEWVTANAVKPAVANMSLGMDQVGVGDDALKKSVAAGIVYSVAAGNSSTDACSVSPARVPEAITVGATDNQDNRASFSNYGTCVDIFGPGVNVTSLGMSNGGTANMSGTSMATPHVTGASALYLAAHPNASAAEVRDALVTNASAGVVKNPGSGSPNKLLNVSFIGGGGPSPGCAAKSNNTPVSIPDAGGAVNVSVTQDGCAGKASASLPVKVDVTHTYTGDLAIELVGPSGTVYSLRKPGGVGAATGVHTTYTVDASAESANGTWTLRVQDVYRFDVGSVTGLTITF